VDLPERPSAAIETIAYFCAAELLTNVAKHSGARHATLEVVHVPGLLRVRTVDGRLQISRPPGGPTLVVVELPSHA
jgi:anti-sigma regulatory factor (Ser/Thr protein kinase)